MANIAKIAHGGSRTLLNPENCCLALIDHQPQMAFGVSSLDRGQLINNVLGLAKAAKTFKIPTVLTTIAAKTFSGPLFPSIQEVFPDHQTIDRTSINAWEDSKFVEAIKNTRRKKIIIAALWTEVCLTLPALDAIAEGFEVYAVEDASGGTSVATHAMAMQRLTQAGVIPVTWLQVMLELQRDWARTSTYEAVMNICQQHAGAYGLGIGYAKAMLGEHGDATTVAA